MQGLVRVETGHHSIGGALKLAGPCSSGSLPIVATSFFFLQVSKDLAETLHFLGRPSKLKTSKVASAST